MVTQVPTEILVWFLSFYVNYWASYWEKWSYLGQKKRFFKSDRSFEICHFQIPEDLKNTFSAHFLFTHTSPYQCVYRSSLDVVPLFSSSSFIWHHQKCSSSLFKEVSSKSFKLLGNLCSTSEDMWVVPKNLVADGSTGQDKESGAILKLIHQ